MPWLLPFTAKGQKCVIVFILALLTTASLQAQLQANFNPDKPGGCSPLTVSFSNTSSGITSGATYLWDFGNGNTSTLQNPSAIFIDEQQYTVKLTVTQNGQSSTRTAVIEVYKRPTVDFSANAVKGCLPFNATFNAQAQPGSGSMASYVWDFGDGSTGQTSSSSISHVYNVKQTAAVSLTVKNNFGCAATIVKPNYMEVIPSLTADFDASQEVLCLVTDPVQFTNKSKGPGTLSYAWEFGDANSSTQTNPSHSYTQAGTYTIKLTTTSSEGCVATKVKTNLLNVANYTTSLQAPSLICRNGTATFTASVFPQPNRIDWEIDGMPYNNYYSTVFHTSFNTPGQHTIKVTATYGTCKQSATKQVTVHDVPKLTGFVDELSTVCGAPTTITVRDTSTDAVKWEWNFDYWWNSATIHATTQQASYTFNGNQFYTVSLKTVNAAGCSSQVTKSIHIKRPNVSVGAIGDNYGGSACKPVTFKFRAITAETIVSYRWVFDNVDISTEAEPTRTFSTPGQHGGRLEYTTDKGCTGVTNFDAIRIIEIPNVEFSSLSGTNICGSTPMTLEATGTNFNECYWYINDNYVGYASPRFSYQFSDTGTYTIKLIAGSVHGCRDTVVKEKYIKVLPPFPRITGVKNSCEIREKVEFTQASRYAEQIRWAFGDNTTETLNGNPPGASHNYPGTGTYSVVLTAIAGQCSLTDVTTVYVLSKPSPVLSATATQVCPNDMFTFTLSNLPNNPYPYSQTWSAPYYFQRIEYGDRTTFNGYNSSIYGYVRPLPYTGTLSNFEPGKINLRMIVREEFFGCLDTTNFIPLVVNGPKAGFRILNNNVCFKDSVRFQDTSRANPGNAIIRWEWNFGDGQQVVMNHSGTVSHLYANPGDYYVTLKVRDAAGCEISSAQFSTYVRVNGPKAAFSAPATVPFNSAVFFNNFTNDFSNYRATYHWSFGDGNTSVLRNPTHTYTVPGVYTIKLTATDPVTGCTSTAEQVINVQLVNAYFNMVHNVIGQTNCPPVLTNFNVIAWNVDSLSWDFGDGNKAGDLRFASHVYEKPGKYIVTLTARGANGLIYRYLDSVIIRQPTVSVSADPWEGCPDLTVNFESTGTYIRNVLWDMGDGTVKAGQANTSHTYPRSGTYAPQLLITDSSGCVMNAKVDRKVVIFPRPDITVSPPDGQACLGQPLRLTASGAQTYTWSPATGLDNPSSDQPIATPTQTTTYRVEGVDARGCRNYADYTLTVRQPIDVKLTPLEEICEGKSTILTASGANTYKWINTTAGLSNTQVANPVASPSATTTYTVVGYDPYGCFTDTAHVQVVVNPLPTVNAGSDLEAWPTDAVQLSATGSSNITGWRWTPVDYLSCTNCPSPISKPLASITYKVTASTAKGCEASDDMSIKMHCDDSRVRIPNAFSPNNDNTNERFGISGISMVRYMVIYNRWGTKVYERTNFIALDEASRWDGKYKGVPQPVGTYVYVVEFQCPGGQVYVKKGTVTLVR